MFQVKANSHPLQRLVSQKKKMTYQMMVRGSDKNAFKLPCEFQTYADYVFSARKNKYRLGETVEVRTVTLKGVLWQACEVTFVEEHVGYALYQMSVKVPSAVTSESRRA